MCIANAVWNPGVSSLSIKPLIAAVILSTLVSPFVVRAVVNTVLALVTSPLLSVSLLVSAITLVISDWLTVLSIVPFATSSSNFS